MGSSMQTLSFPLTNRYSRLIFQYGIGTHSYTFMYDSGASVPVWCTGEDLLLRAFPDAQKTPYTCHVTGFGKGEETGSVYCLPTFTLRTEDGAAFVIRNLLLITMSKPFIGCDFLISETMLSKTDTMIYRTQERRIQIDFEDKEYHCTGKLLGQKLLDISVWAQNN